MKTPLLVALALVLITVALVVTLGTHGSMEPAATAGAAELSERTARALAGSLVRTPAVEAMGSTVTLGRHTLTVTTTTDYVTDKGGAVLAGLDFTCVVDGAPAPQLHAGSIGIGDSTDAALQAAIEEWAVQYGAPIARALLEPQPGDAAPSQFTSGPVRAFPGATGFRGHAPATFQGADAFHSAFIAHVRPLVEPLVATGGLHTLTLTLVFKEGAPLEGECRLDGAISEPVLSAARRFAWPQVTGTFMLKQYYVFDTAK